MVIDNKHDLDNIFEQYIMDYIKRYGIALFLEYVANIIRRL